MEDKFDKVFYFCFMLLLILTTIFLLGVFIFGGMYLIETECGIDIPFVKFNL